MWYLILGLVIGVVVDRYILPVFDAFLELFNQWITKICTSIQIDTNLMSLDYQEIAEQGNPLPPVIGFTGDHQSDDEYYEDDEEEDEKRNKNGIGFVK